jgi:hypothetical protein
VRLEDGNNAYFDTLNMLSSLLPALQAIDHLESVMGAFLVSHIAIYMAVSRGQKMNFGIFLDSII